MTESSQMIEESGRELSVRDKPSSCERIYTYYRSSTPLIHPLFLNFTKFSVFESSSLPKSPLIFGMTGLCPILEARLGPI